MDAKRGRARTLGPLLAERIQAGLRQVFRTYYDMKLDVSVKQKKPGLRKHRDLGGVFHVNDQNRAAVTSDFCEVDRLWFQVIEYALHFISYRAVFHCRVKCIVRDFNLDKHSHRSLLEKKISFIVALSFPEFVDGNSGAWESTPECLQPRSLKSPPALPDSLIFNFQPNIFCYILARGFYLERFGSGD
jgi:hypothetical protein